MKYNGLFHLISVPPCRGYRFLIVIPTELYLIYLEIALSNRRAEAKNMTDLNAVGGRLAAEVNGRPRPGFLSILV